MDKNKIHISFNEKVNLVLKGIENSCLQIDFTNREHLNNFLSPNQFLTVCNFQDGEIQTSFTKNIENVLGYLPQEFTSEELYKITIPQHLVLALEYAIITTSLLENDSIQFDNNYGYSVEFTVMLKEKPVRLERFCWIYKYREGKPYQFLDIWTNKSQRLDNSKFVIYSFFTPTPKETKEMYQQFYSIWTKKRLCFSFTIKQLAIIKYLMDSNIKREEIALNMNLSKKMIDEHLKNAKERVNNFIEDLEYQDHNKDDYLKFELLKLLLSEKRISKEKQLLDFARKYGLIYIAKV